MSTLQVYDISTGGGSMASALRSQGGRGAARTLHRACCPHLARASATLTGRRKEATLEHEDVTTIIYYRRYSSLRISWPGCVTRLCCCETSKIRSLLPLCYLQSVLFAS